MAIFGHQGTYTRKNGQNRKSAQTPTKVENFDQPLVRPDFSRNFGQDGAFWAPEGLFRPLFFGFLDFGPPLKIVKIGDFSDFSKFLLGKFFNFRKLFVGTYPQISIFGRFSENR